MQIRKLIGASLLAAAPVLVHAERNSLLNHIDAIYLPTTDLDAYGSSFDGDGFGLRLKAEIVDGVFMHIENQRTSHDTDSIGDIDLNQLRAGAGYALSLSDALVLTAEAEYVSLKYKSALFSERESGYGLHLGVLAPLSEQFSLLARVGHVDVDAADGTEWSAGLRFKVAGNIGLMLEYRETKLDDIKLKDMRIGVGYHF